jgi:predicted kinase
MVMLVGPTGCGKSTFRKKHLAHLPCVSPDDFVVGKWTAKKATHAWQHARNQAIELMAEQQSFVADAQFLDPAVRAEWLAIASGFKFRAHAFCFNTAWKQLRQNQKARGARGLYGTIPIDVQRRSYQLMKTQLTNKSIYKEGFALVQVVEFGSVIEIGDIS